jgi:hypothetical protein
MTDLFGEPLDPPEDPAPLAYEDGDGQFFCTYPGCDRGPDGGPYASPSAAGRGVHMRFIHGVISTTSGSSKSHKKKKPATDKAPPSVTINLETGKGKKDAGLEQVEKRALQLIQGGAAILLLAGLQADAVDLNNGAKPIAGAVRDLAEYEEWLRKLAAGGESAGRLMAWINLLVVVAAVGVPIAARHKVLPEKWAQASADMFANAEAFSASMAEQAETNAA